MLKDLKKTTKHTSIYALGNITIKLVGILLIPLYTDPKYLSQEEFGALAVLEASAQIIISVLSMAMSQNLTRWYWDEKYSKDKNSIFFTSYSFLLLLLIPLAIILSVSADSLSILLFNDNQYQELLQLTIIASCIQIPNNITLTLVKLQARSAFFSTLQLIKVTIILTLTLVGIIHLNMGLKAIWLSALIGESLIFIILLPYNYRNSTFKFDLKILKEMMSYGFPLMLASISGIILATVDRYMLSSMSGLENTAIYSLGYRIANTLKTIITTSLTMALSPLKMQYINKPNNQRFYSKINTYTAFIFILGLLGVSLFSLEIIKTFTGSEAYWEAYSIIPIISYSLFFGLLKDNTLIGLSITKRTKIIGTSIFITSLLNITLNYFLIPIWGIYGASSATLFSQLFFFLFISISSQKAYPIPYEWKKVMLLFLTSLFIISIGFSVQEMNTLPRIIIKIVLISVFPFLLHLFHFYDKVEVEQIKTIFNNWKSPKELKKNIKRLIK